MNSLSENTNHNSITTHSDSYTSHFITTDSHDVITENEKYKGPKIVIDKDLSSYFGLTLCERPDSFGTYCIDLFTSRYFH